MGTRTRAISPPRSRPAALGLAELRRQQRQERRREHRVEAERRGSPIALPEAAPIAVPTFQQDEDRDAGGDERPARRLRVGLRPGHRGRLVDHELRQASRRRSGPAGATPARCRRGRSAAPGSRPGTIAAIGPPPAASTPMNANCDAPVKTSSDIAIACGVLRPAACASAPNDTANARPRGRSPSHRARPFPGTRWEAWSARACGVTILRQEWGEIAMYELKST